MTAVGDVDLRIAAHGVKRQAACTVDRVAVGVVEIESADGNRRFERHRARHRDDVAQHRMRTRHIGKTAGPIRWQRPVSVRIDVPSCRLKCWNKRKLKDQSRDPLPFVAKWA